METFELLGHGLLIALTPKHILLMLAGVMLGLLVGVLPGLGAPNGVAILLPLTLALEPVSAIILLTSMYWGALFGGSITSILFNIPGEPSSVATTFDGHPMALQGRAGEALTGAFTSAFLGALAGVILLTFFGPMLATFALRFGPPEFFAVFFLAFCSFIGLSQGDPLKVLASLALGFSISQIGMDTVTASTRLTFGWQDLVKGISFLVVVIGMFGIGEVLTTREEPEKLASAAAYRLDMRVVLQTWAKLPRYWMTWLRSVAIGCWMGITPGGPTAASFMSYAVARKLSPNRENFGKGEIEGVLAPEAADHSAGTSALLPMLALGIPGSATAAILLAALVLWGLRPGPLLFVEQKDFVWGLIASMYLSNFVALVLVMLTIPLFASVMRMPFGILGPLIVVICLIGAYSVNNNVFDVWLMLGFGVLGYLMKKADYPVAPLILAMVIADKAEDAFRQSMIISGGKLSIFWANPLVATMMAMALLLLSVPLIGWAMGRIRSVARA